MIFDAHCHVFPQELLTSAACRNDPAFSVLYGADPLGRTADVEQLIGDMKSRGISRAVISGFPWPAPCLPTVYKEFIFRQCSGNNLATPAVHN
jgi:hypothetical protein